MKLSTILAPLVLAATLGQATAQDFKVAVVDFKKVILAHPEAKKLEAALKQEGENATTVIKTKEEELEKLRKDAAMLQEKKGADGKLTQDSINMLRDMQGKAIEIQRSMMDVQQRTQIKLTQQRVEGLKKVVEEVAGLVKKANGGKYALVLDSSARTPDGTFQLLDSPGADDLTATVIGLLPK